MRHDFSDVTSENEAERLGKLFPIILADHNPEYNEYYEQEKAFLQSVFGDIIIRINHIGSTAVPNLLAKPTIDILLEIKDELMQLDKEKTILEIGVGSGRLAIQALPNCKHLTGIDISPKTIKRAEENLAEFNNKTLVCDDFFRYQFTERFNVIYSSLTFFHIKEKQKAINRIAELLSNGDRAVISLNKDQSTELDFGTRKIPLYPDNPEEIKKYLLNAGLKVVKTQEIEFAWIIVAEK